MNRLFYILICKFCLVQMFFKVMGWMDLFDFIFLILLNNQEYIVYVGGDFYVSVYVKLNDSVR